MLSTLYVSISSPLLSSLLLSPSTLYTLTPHTLYVYVKEARHFLILQYFIILSYIFIAHHGAEWGKLYKQQGIKELHEFEFLRKDGALTDINSASNVEFDKGTDITETKARVQFTPDSQATKINEQTIEFDLWHGYYRSIPELQAVIDRLTTWVIYGGDDADKKESDITFKRKADREKFEKFIGNGKDTPKQILSNLFRVGKICGNSIGEIVRSKKKGIINLKPINPGTIKVISNEKGFLTGFEQRIIGSSETTPLGLNQVFFLPWNRIADEIIGISTIEKLTKIIDYRHQAMEDLAEVFHRYVVPFWLFYVDTDDETEISTFNNKIKNMIQKRDHMVIPKDTVDKHERLSVPQFATLDPLNWIKHLERYFLLSEGVPEIISGIGRETADASSRMIYLSWRIIVIANQKIYEDAIKAQLGIDIKLPRPINILAPEVTEGKTQVLPKKDENAQKSPEKKNE